MSHPNLLLGHHQPRQEKDTLYHQGYTVEFLLFRNQQQNKFPSMVQWYKKESHNTHASFTKLGTTIKISRIIFGDPQLLVIKCYILFQLEKIVINYKTLAFWFLQVYMCYIYGTMNWWQAIEVFEPNHDFHHLNLFRPFELIHQHYVHDIYKLMQH